MGYMNNTLRCFEVGVPLRVFTEKLMLVCFLIHGALAESADIIIIIINYQIHVHIGP